MYYRVDCPWLKCSLCVFVKKFEKIYEESFNCVDIMVTSVKFSGLPYCRHWAAKCRLSDRVAGLPAFKASLPAFYTLRTFQKNNWFPFSINTGRRIIAQAGSNIALFCFSNNRFHWSMHLYRGLRLVWYDSVGFYETFPVIRKFANKGNIVISSPNLQCLLYSVYLLKGSG